MTTLFFSIPEILSLPLVPTSVAQLHKRPPKSTSVCAPVQRGCFRERVCVHFPGELWITLDYGHKSDERNPPLPLDNICRERYLRMLLSLSRGLNRSPYYKALGRASQSVLRVTNID
uniref:Putative secreted protein n=1 Tax=Ixodes scapularis TaxID=6945 RepID=A0A4D5S3Q4_IXOSC